MGPLVFGAGRVPSVKTIGYVPLERSLNRPGDRRRFPAYVAHRGIGCSVVDSWDGMDLVVLTTEADLVRWRSAPTGVRVVFDLPDAVLDERPSFRSRTRGLAKWATGSLHRPVFRHQLAIRRLVERADAVVCSTPEHAMKLADIADNVHVALDYHGEFGVWPPKTRTDGQGLDVLWEGLLPTLDSVRQVVPALRDLARSREVVLHLVTDRFAPRYMNRFLVCDVERLVARWGVRIKVHDWSQDTLQKVARLCDFAVVPVDGEDPYAMGKPENRMRIFWRLGLPVVASDTPAHRRAIEVAGVSVDTLCGRPVDWDETIRWFAEDQESRQVAAEAGHAAAIGPYGDESVLGAWDGVMESVGFV